MNRREFMTRAAAGAAGAGLLAGPGFPARAGATTVGPQRAPLSVAGCLWGAHIDPRGGLTREASLAAMETAVGRTFAVERQYQVWNEPLPTDYMRWTSAQGRIPYVGWHAWRDSPRGPAVLWSSIAAGAQDTWIRTQARAIRDWGQPLYMSFHHEPEDDSRCGTKTDFKAAYARVRNLFIAEGATNVTWVLALMASVYAGGYGGAASWAPPAFDVVGVDGYNRFPVKRSKPWKTFSTIFSPARAFAAARGKPLAICEFGSVEQTAGGYPGDPLAKAKWIADAATTVKSWPEVLFTSYSHVTTSEGYDYWIDTSAASLSAFAAAGEDPYFAPPLA